MDNGVSGQGIFWKENPSVDQAHVGLAGSMISSTLQTGQFALLVRLFSSLLRKHVQIYQKAFLATLSYKKKLVPGFSPLLLLKHIGTEDSLQNELLERIGCNSGDLESVLSLLSRLDATVNKKASGILSRSSWECMLHGFPFNLSTASATMLSCILSIRGILVVLDGLLRINDARENVALENEVLQQILDAVMTIKLDRIFEGIHGICDTIYHSLSSELEWSIYANLMLMKQIEGFLRDISSSGVSDGSIHEWMITRIIEILNGLRKDPSKSAIFQFYLGTEDVPGQINKLLQLHRGDCLVLIDSLDTCYSESLNVKVLGFFLDLLSGDQFPDIKNRILRKFLDKDINCLSKWLEKRLLGSIMDSAGEANCAKGSSNSLRESTMNFILCLMSSASEQSKDLQHHIFESALLSLETAFLLFDIHIAKSYFCFIAQIVHDLILAR